MVKLIVDSKNIETLNCILYFSNKLIENASNFELGCSTSDGKVFIKIGEGKYSFTFNDTLFNMEYKMYKNHPPIDITPNYSYYSNIEIENKSKDNIKNFIKSSIEFYKNDVLKEKNNSDRINVFTLVSNSWFLFNKLKKRNIDTIYLHNNTNNEILSIIQDFQKKETIDMYEKSGIIYKKNFLLNGGPGTGKTSLIISVASELNYNLYFLTIDKNLNDSNFLRIIKNIKENSILVLEDSNHLFSEKKNIISLITILNVLDGIASKHGLLIFITTNHLINIEPALMRSGRIDHFYQFENIKIKETKKMVNNILKNKKIEDCKIIDEFINSLKNYSISPAELQNYILNNSDNLLENIETLNKNNDNNNLYQ